jgi:hypothetical protein
MFPYKVLSLKGILDARSHEDLDEISGGEVFLFGFRKN